ncbi:hypothetical protein QWY31_05105 [Cytophagales bacterium LB-30]|uniref:Anti-sigma factor n=1 Tax=Shiella aurantiaca TaxID=3058365 RepID=A0ABT8F3I4_9BACT|nr:hypothetical protein [Shiella aurantiaca]MDN4164868.1 hypothetical protein [Shiella aurantiaca]
MKEQESNSKPKCGKQEDCIQMLYLIIDGQASEDQIKEFSKHMKDCTPCYKHHELEQAIKQTLQAKIDNRPIPPGLIESIKTKIRETV